MREDLSFLHGSFIEQRAEHNCFKMISATKLQKQVCCVDFLHSHRIAASEKQWFFHPVTCCKTLWPLAPKHTAEQQRRCSCCGGMKWRNNYVNTKLNALSCKWNQSKTGVLLFWPPCSSHSLSECISVGLPLTRAECKVVPQWLTLTARREKQESVSLSFVPLFRLVTQILSI